MKSELNMHGALNKDHVPSDLAIGESSVEGGMVFDDDDIVDVMEPGDFLSFPRAYLPPPMEPPQIQALRPAYERDGLFVGFDRIGENMILEELPPFMCFQGNQGQDIMKMESSQVLVVCSQWAEYYSKGVPWTKPSQELLSLQ
jgi:hypothetical protein